VEQELRKQTATPLEFSAVQPSASRRPARNAARTLREHRKIISGTCFFGPATFMPSDSRK
jgi:hypothetical protein